MTYIYCVKYKGKLTPYSNEYENFRDLEIWYKDESKGAWLSQKFKRDFILCNKIKHNTGTRNIIKYIEL